MTIRVSAPPDFVPQYASEGAAGADLRARIQKPVTLKPGERTGIPTGVRMEIPSGFEGQVRPRSGLALRNGITLANSPGTIDSDYRGEIVCPVINLGEEPFTIEPAMRIAQLVIAPVVQVSFERVDSLEVSARGENGFGSTGVQ
jgi:dUTP pyrophosphatase